MKQSALLITAFFVFSFALSAEITQEKADEIVLERMSEETRPHSVFAKAELQAEGKLITTSTGKQIELDYPCRVYFIQYTDTEQGFYLIVNADNGNLLQINAINAEGPEDLAEWRELGKEPDVTNNISGTWIVKATSISGKLVDISRPSDADYPDISITIPNTTQGFIDGNTFYNMIEWRFVISGQQQIHIQNVRQFVENQLLIRLNSGVDAYKFAADSNQGITPIRLIAPSLNIWLFGTDGTIPLRDIVSTLSQHPDVNIVSYNNAGISLREGETEVNAFVRNMRNTENFSVSNNELIFMDSQGNPLIVFTKPEESFPKEIPFEEYSLEESSCRWIVNWSLATYNGDVIIINSHEDLKNHITCNDFPAIDFSMQSLLLVYGLSPNDVRNITVTEIQQVSANDFLVSIDVLRGSLRVIGRWTVAIIIPKTVDNANIELAVQQSQHILQATFWKVKTLNIEGQLTNIVSSPGNVIYQSILLKITDNVSSGSAVGCTFKNMFLVDFIKTTTQIFFSNYRTIPRGSSEDSIGEAFIHNLLNTVRFEKSNDKLIFSDAQNNPLIIFTNSLNTE